MSRPAPYAPRARRTLWLDYASARGVDDLGRGVQGPSAGGRRRVSLVDLLDTAGAHGAERVYLTGERPAAGWLEGKTPGWSASPAGHYYDTDDPCGRFVSVSGLAVQLRRAAPWFGDKATPRQARDAHQVLAHQVRAVWRDDRAVLMDSPTATGQQLWALSMPKDWDGAQLPDDAAALIRATTPQHRIEVSAGCYEGCELHWRATGNVGQAHYLDGRMMFGALLRELATAPAVHLTAAQATDLYDTQPFARARYQVSFTVPAGWQHIGVLMSPMQTQNGRRWHAISRPGEQAETWCDAAELHQALGFGWDVRILQALHLTGNGRPLDTWRDRILRLRELCGKVDADQTVRDLARYGARALLVTTIGGFHSTGRDRYHLAPYPAAVPPGVPFTQRKDNTCLYRLPSKLTGNAARFAHPELSAQVWGRAHTRLLLHRANGTGAMALPGDQVLGMWGDALYLACDPQWPDDGKVGRLRTKGSITGSIRRPRSIPELDRLRQRITEGKP